jgi:hypothetical protein
LEGAWGPGLPDFLEKEKRVEATYGIQKLHKLQTLLSLCHFVSIDLSA